VSCADDPVSQCCVPGVVRFDRLLVLSKSQRLFVYDFCGGAFIQRVPPISGWPGGSFAELRAQPVVAEEVGTFYFQDNYPQGEHFFAFDLFQPDRLKWVYESGVDHQNSTFCKYGVPAGGRDCYPAPIPWVHTQSVSGNAITLTVCPHHATKPSIEELSSTSCKPYRVAGEVTTDPNDFDTVSLDLAYGVGWHNLTAGTSASLTDPATPSSGHSPCFTGTVPGIAGAVNEIVLTAQTKFGKKGSTRIQVYLP